jgi:hypothetical protein
MEKQAVIKPGKTPDTEKRLPQAKTAAAAPRTQTRALDDDVTKRLARAAGQ